MYRKGIILAGGTGSRLYPVTFGVSKQLLPVYDKPMIYYPISVLMLSGIREILIITTPNDLPQYQKLLKNGTQWGLEFTYAIQEKPRGIGDAFLIGERFLGHSFSALALGDNLFYAHNLTHMLTTAYQTTRGATLFVYPVNNPSAYGVIEFDDAGLPWRIVEKPENSRSNLAITGLYFYDPSVIDIAKHIKPSKRQELEISCINQYYLEQKQLNILNLGRGSAWLDNGTHTSLLKASQFVEAIETRQGLKIACLEEIALQKNYITLSQIEDLAHTMKNTTYGQYLLKLLNEKSYEYHASSYFS